MPFNCGHDVRDGRRHERIRTIAPSVAAVVKVVSRSAIFEHEAVERVPRQVIAGVALHRLPLPQRRERQERREVWADHERGKHTR